MTAQSRRVCTTLCTLNDDALDRTSGGLGGRSALAQYVQDTAQKHISGAIQASEDWQSDTTIKAWIGDCPHDILTVAVGQVLGVEKLETLASVAEAADDHWLTARIAILAGHVAHQNSQPVKKIRTVASRSRRIDDGRRCGRKCRRS